MDSCSELIPFNKSMVQLLELSRMSQDKVHFSVADPQVYHLLNY